MMTSETSIVVMQKSLYGKNWIMKKSLRGAVWAWSTKHVVDTLHLFLPSHGLFLLSPLFLVPNVNITRFWHTKFHAYDDIINPI